MSKWYIVETDNFDSLPYWINEGIPAQHMSVREPREIEGIAFPDEYMDFVLHNIAKTGEIRGKYATNIDNLFFLDLELDLKRFMDGYGHHSQSDNLDSLPGLTSYISPDSIEASKKADNSEEYMANREKYVQICMGRTKKDLTTVEKNILAQEQRIDELSSQLNEVCKQHRMYVEQLQDLSTVHGKTGKKIASEYDKLWDLPLVRSVKMENDTLVVWTDTIKIEGIEIGRFKIYLKLDGEILLINSSKKTPNDFHHPNVNKAGIPCLGNVSKAIPKFMADYEFAIVIQILIEFLKTYNPKDRYLSLNHWR